LLSRSRFIAPASHPLRFYQEYFQASTELNLQKERRRWRILYKGVLFYINIDRMIKPAVPGLFIEIKARTWSLSDAEHKAKLAHEMLEILGIASSDVVYEEYLEMQMAQR
jgi:5-methylthioadenosine/S-adenosylhomocysteine deaminase